MSELSDLQLQRRRLVRDIAGITGEPDAVVVLKALEERLQRLTEPTTPAERAERILRILDGSLWQNIPKRRLGQTGSQKQTDEILGYGPEGV